MLEDVDEYRRGQVSSAVTLTGVAGLVLLMSVLQKAVALECPVIKVQSILRLVSSCGVSFKIIIFPMGLMSDSFSSKYISPFWEKVSLV